MISFTGYSRPKQKEGKNGGGGRKEQSGKPYIYRKYKFTENNYKMKNNERNLGYKRIYKRFYL